MIMNILVGATILSMIVTFGLMAFSIDLESRGKRGQLLEKVDALVFPFTVLTMALLAVSTLNALFNS